MSQSIITKLRDINFFTQQNKMRNSMRIVDCEHEKALNEGHNALFYISLNGCVTVL